MRKNPYLESGTLLLNEASVPFVVIRSAKRRRTIALKIDAKQGLIMLAPLRTAFKELKDMALNNAKWILKEYAAMEHSQKMVVEKKLVTGELLPYLGVHYPLYVHGVLHFPQACCLLNNQLHVRVPNGIPENKRRQLVSDKLIAWYRKQAEEIVQQRLQIWVNASGLQPVSWRITSALRRWGSCNAKNHICINWRLIFAPLDLVDYVIVHELCHIVHKNHSSAFWARVGRILPDYKRRRAELKTQVMHFA